jgi:hypothetical protein
VLLDDEDDILRSATCPNCHTPASPAQSAPEAAGGWRCVRCGQRWDAEPLAAVAAYVAWASDREHIGNQTAEDAQDAPPTKQLGGTL